MARRQRDDDILVNGSATLPPAPSWAELARTPSALFLDIDGTLLEFEMHPGLVRATDGLIAMLQSVSDALDGAVALISGRPLTDIDRVFKPWAPFAAGVHGAEVRGREGTRHHQVDDKKLDELRHLVNDRLERLPGAWVEDKGYGFAIHYRTSPELESGVIRLAADLADASAGALEVQPGSLVQELRPAAFDKGLAINELMLQDPFLGRRPVVVGDDRTDEFAFEAVNERGGVSVLVGPRSDTVARYRIPDPVAVRGWLSELLEEVPR
jgi:trehalose 6-phosphate phosphatase